MAILDLTLQAGRRITASSMYLSFTYAGLLSVGATSLL
jgi:hypothetical protein